MRSIALLAGVILASAWVGAAQAEPPACAILATDAATKSDAAALRALHEAALETGCGASLDQVGVRVARALTRDALTRPVVDRAGLLGDALSYGRAWETLEALGDLAAARRDHREAAGRYQDALIELENRLRTPEDPGIGTVTRLSRRAQTHLLLAPTYVSIPRRADGSAGALASPSIRGHAITRVALPIEFHFAAITFTEKGARAVDDLAEILLDEEARGRVSVVPLAGADPAGATTPPAKPIRLVGHTDAKGDAAFNRALSLRRANAVLAALRARGVRRAFEVLGLGEAEPYEEDRALFTEAEFDQLCRRVELVR